MKMNMMMGQGYVAGAVAINGGVGVMEMRRPQVNMDLLPSVDDVMNSVAAVAAEIAVNAHITLRELKPGRVKISLRTGPRVDACAVCRVLGGGGHKAAAGATVEGTMDEVKAGILAAYREVVG